MTDFKKSKKPLTYHFGNALMLLAITGALFVYLPIINLYLSPPKISAHLNSNYYLTIPKISAQAPIVSNVNPWDENDYLPKLQQGIAAAQGSVNPGETGEIYLFAHSSDEPWRITRYNIAFFKLGDLQNGDKIVITKNDKNYNYIVYDKKVFWPTQVEYLNYLQKNQEATEAASLPPLILQTCTPVGTSLKRLLVFAKPI